MRNRDAPYWRAPVVSWLIAQATGAPVGIARGALRAFLTRLPGRLITYTDYASQADAPLTHLQVGEALMKIDSADFHARRANELVESAAHGDFTIEARARVRAHSAYATALAREAATSSSGRAAPRRSRRTSRSSASSATSRRSRTTPC